MFSSPTTLEVRISHSSPHSQSSSPFLPCHPGLPHQEVTLAELVKSVGYNTAHLGKWHLGVGESLQYLPTTQGFDYYLVR